MLNIFCYSFLLCICCLELENVNDCPHVLYGCTVYLCPCLNLCFKLRFQWVINHAKCSSPPFHPLPSMEQTSAMISYLMEAIVSFQTGYVCCTKPPHNSLALFGVLCVPDSDSTCHLRQGIWLQLSSPSWKTHHGSSSQRNPRCRSILPSSSSSHHPQCSPLFTSASVFMMKWLFLMYTAASITIYSS